MKDMEKSITHIQNCSISRLLFVLGIEKTLLRIFLSILRQILFLRDLYDDVEPLIVHAVCNSQHASAITSILKVTVSDYGDHICVKVDDWVGATELIIKLKPKVVERLNFASAFFESVEGCL